MTFVIPSHIDHSARNSVLAAMAAQVTALGGTVTAIAPTAGETTPNWILFLNRIITGANGLGGTALPVYLSLDYSAFDSVASAIVSKLNSFLPSNTAAPVVSGTGTVGQTLTTTNGTWSNSPTSYAYQWLRDGAAIAGATATTYVLASADSTHTISCRVTASNAGGAGTPVTSNGIACA